MKPDKEADPTDSKKERDPSHLRNKNAETQDEGIVQKVKLECEAKGMAKQAVETIERDHPMEEASVSPGGGVSCFAKRRRRLAAATPRAEQKGGSELSASSTGMAARSTK